MSGSIIGRRFGKLTVIDYCMDSDATSEKVVCKCDCGKELFHGSSSQVAVFNQNHARDTLLW